MLRYRPPLPACRPTRASSDTLSSQQYKHLKSLSIVFFVNFELNQKFDILC